MAEGDPRVYRHLFPQRTGESSRYERPGGGGSGKPAVPERDREQHARMLTAKLDEIAPLASEVVDDRRKRGFDDEGFVVAFEVDAVPGFNPISFERSGNGPTLLSYKERDGRGIATVYVKSTKQLDFYRKKLARYEEKETGTPLFAPTEDVRLATLRELWTDLSHREPPTDDRVYRWEVWLRDDKPWPELAADIRRAGVEVSDKVLRFPNRIVATISATPSDLADAATSVPYFSEVRRVPPIVADIVEFPVREQQEWAESVVDRTWILPEAVRVCVLDTGVDAGHPLLEGLIAENGTWSYRPGWTGDPHGHGTQMAGLAAYGMQLEEALESEQQVQLRHQIESAAIIRPGEPIPEDQWGVATQMAVDAIESMEPRAKRVFNLCIGGPKSTDGTPSAWSAAIDQLAAGTDSELSGPRLFVVAAGNAEIGREGYSHPDANYTEQVEDPSQAWNAISVGAFTQRDFIDEREFPDWRLLASPDDLSPFSTTGLAWLAEETRGPRPSKPDLVVEGGNAARAPDGYCSEVDSLSLLTTQSREKVEGLFATTAMTSAAAALVSHMAAEIWVQYPDLRPETVRALLVHSARWTDTMRTHFPELAGKRERVRQLLHCFGYGVPSLERAIASAESATTLVIEDEIQPYTRERNEHEQWKEPGAGYMRVHTLPWPDSALETVADCDAELRVTLSYFVEPNPALRSEEDRYTYPSHLLRFWVAKPGESLDEFSRRINKKARVGGGTYSPGGGADEWDLWEEAVRGSIHSDCWRGSAADLLGRRFIAIVPVTGWWKTFKSQERWDSVAHYSLVVSLECSEQASLYTEIANEIGVETEIVIKT